LHSLFVCPLTSKHNRLPPAPLKLRPYGALQMLIIIIIIIIILTFDSSDIFVSKYCL